MGTPETLETRIAAALAAGREQEAAELLGVAFGVGGSGTRALPELLEELAEYYAEQGRTDDAVAVMSRALDAGWTGRPDGRCRIAEFLLRGGLVDEAVALYEAVRADTPDDVCLYYAAGIELTDAGEAEVALQWLTDGLHAAVRGAEAPAGVVTALAERRRAALRTLGRDQDRLDDDVASLIGALGEEHPGTGRSHDGGRDTFPFAWLPPDDFERALRTWPGFAAQWDGHSHAEYCRSIEQDAQRLAAVSTRRPTIAPVRVDAVSAWAAARGLDAGEAAVRDAYAAHLDAEARATSWPPEGDAACWCSSGTPYADCCGRRE